MKNFEMADANSVDELVSATQKALIHSMRDVIKMIRKEEPKSQGMSWEQIDYFFKIFESKNPRVITQKEEV